MKVKVISRKVGDYVRETNQELHKLPRNYDPKLHPFEVQREYQRALNAVKLDRVFARPFVGALNGHSDVVECLMKHPTSLSTIVSGAADGFIKIWNVSTKQELKSIHGHDGIIRALCPSPCGKYFFSLDQSANIKQWTYDNISRIGHLVDEDSDDGDDEPNHYLDHKRGPNDPIHTIIGKYTTYGMDHHQTKPWLITCGDKVELWEETRSDPLSCMSWGNDITYSVKFNPVETDIVAATSGDNSITLYDMRESTPLRKVVLKMRSNTICWNPMEPFSFTAANEDHDLYTFDMRNLKVARQIHKDHVGAVIDVDYSPTGREFVTGSYDKSVRIFKVEQERSREVYHTKRMQRLTSVLFSLDSKYIMCGSQEMDIRIWKANRSEKLGLASQREELNFQYQDKLKDKFASHPEVRRIARHRHVPKSLFNATKEKNTMVKAEKKKEQNRRRNNRKDKRPQQVNEKVARIVREDT